MLHIKMQELVPPLPDTPRPSCGILGISSHRDSYRDDYSAIYKVSMGQFLINYEVVVVEVVVVMVVGCWLLVVVMMMIMKNELL